MAELVSLNRLTRPPLGHLHKILHGEDVHRIALVEAGTIDGPRVDRAILDLPRAVARLMAKRCLKRAQEAALSRQPTEKATEQAGAEEGAAEGVSYGAFHAAYGRFVAGEEEKVRVYRVLKAPGRPWLLQEDIEELVWCAAQFWRNSGAIL